MKKIACTSILFLGLCAISMVGLVIGARIDLKEGRTWRPVENRPTESYAGLNWLTDDQNVSIVENHAQGISRLSPNHDAYFHLATPENGLSNHRLLTKNAGPDGNHIAELPTSAFPTNISFISWSSNGKWVAIGSDSCIIDFYEYDAPAGAISSSGTNTIGSCKFFTWDTTGEFFLVRAHAGGELNNVFVIDSQGETQHIISIPGPLFQRGGFHSLTAVNGEVYVYTTAETYSRVHRLNIYRGTASLDVNCILPPPKWAPDELIWFDRYNDCGLWDANMSINNDKLWQYSLEERALRPWENSFDQQIIHSAETYESDRRVYSLKNVVAVQIGIDVMVLDLNDYTFMVYTQAKLFGIDREQEQVIIHQNSAFKAVDVHTESNE